MLVVYADPCLRLNREIKIARLIDLCLKNIGLVNSFGAHGGAEGEKREILFIGLFVSTK